MGFLDAIFGNKKTYFDVLNENIKRLFHLYGINDPSNEDQFKCTFALTVAGIAMLNDIAEKNVSAKENLLAVMKELVVSGERLISGCNVKIRNIATDKNEVEKILLNLPSEINADENTNLDGRTAFRILFKIRGQILIDEICNKGLFGAVGQATIFVGDMVLGMEKSKTYFMASTTNLMQFLDDIMDIYKKN